MRDRKFKTGQRVNLAQNNMGGSMRGGPFTIVKLLPEERGMHQYRVKSVADGHERVVLENELS